TGAICGRQPEQSDQRITGCADTPLPCNNGLSRTKKGGVAPARDFALSLHAVLKPAFPCCHLPDDPWPNSLSGSTIRCAWTHHTRTRFRHNTENYLTL